MNRNVSLGFVGDLLIDREAPLEALSDARALLTAPDVLFGNLEGAFSDDPQPPDNHHVKLIAATHNLRAVAEAGFKVLSLANNHALDAGPGALMATIERLHAAGVMTCGAGHGLQAAREPAVLRAGNLRVAYLAYASVFPAGYEAADNRAGVVPFRAQDSYVGHRDYHLPGTFPHIRSTPDEHDLAALLADIASARERADLVVVSFHWGDMLHPFLLTDHERKTARLCVDHGADMIVGHHHHTLRGMEWYRGKPILYGLGHFVFDCRAAAHAPRFTAYEHGVFPREGWPLLPLHPDTRMTVMACVVANASRVEQVGFVPCRLRADGRVQPVHPHSDEGREVVAYVQRCIASQGLQARLDVNCDWHVGHHDAVQVLPA
jgi:poly-gamma-glutamate capsule biosynthesis protein CapA/YwtB (metallophosphatase superfamily)